MKCSLDKGCSNIKIRGRSFGQKKKNQGFRRCAGMKRQENRAENGQNWGNLLEIQVLASRARGRRFKSCTAHHPQNPQICPQNPQVSLRGNQGVTVRANGWESRRSVQVRCPYLVEACKVQCKTLQKFLVPGRGVEPRTPGFSVRCSTTELPWHPFSPHSIIARKKRE